MSNETNEIKKSELWNTPAFKLTKCQKTQNGFFFTSAEK